MSPDPAIFSQVGTPDTSMQAFPLPHTASQSPAIVVHTPVEVTHACPEAQSIARHGLVLSTSASWTCQSEDWVGRATVDWAMLTRVREPPLTPPSTTRNATTGLPFTRTIFA